MSSLYNEDAEALRRLLEEDDWGFWRRCTFCPKQFPNFSALMSHIKRDHPGKLEAKD